MEGLKLLAPPLIGAVIGYCTNYIAVKMLFRPLKPIKIGRITLPFTPGIIPKRKGDLAKAIGNMVGKSLIGEEEIRGILTSSAMKDTVVTRIAKAIDNTIKENSIKDIGQFFMEEEAYENKKENVVECISDKIVDGVKSIDIAGIIVKEGSTAVKNMGGMISMFINEQVIASFAEPIGIKVEEYIGNNGKDLIRTKVEKEICNLQSKPIKELISVENIDIIIPMLNELYDTIMDKEIAHIIKAFDICTIVENKVNDMDVLELEKLLMSVMKNELGAVIDLGALIGFVLGLFNLFIK